MHLMDQCHEVQKLQKEVQKKPAALMEENGTTRIDNEPKNLEKSEVPGIKKEVPSLEIFKTLLFSKNRKDGRIEEQKSEPAKVADGHLKGTKRKTEKAHSEENSKSLKVEAHLKEADLQKLTNTHAEVEDLLMSDNEDAPEDANIRDADVNLKEALDDANVNHGQSSDVLSIQDQLLQDMQDSSSEEDEDEDADNRLKEFVGEGFSEEESEDLDGEKGGEKVEPAEGDGDEDVGNLISEKNITDNIAYDEFPRKDQNEEDLRENDNIGRNETEGGDLGDVRDDEEASEAKLGEVFNFENDETAPNSDNEEKNEEVALAMSTEMLEKLNNLLSSED